MEPNIHQTSRGKDHSMDGYLKGLYHRRDFIQVCLLIDPESYEWGLSARSVDLK